MVLAEGDHPPCSPHSRESECDSRLGIPSSLRLQRLEAESFSLQGNPGAARSIHSRSLCQLPKCSARNLLQLEARPISNSSGCSESVVVQSSSVYVSPFALIGRCLHHIRIDKVAQAVLVAPLWPANAWSPTQTSMLVHNPIILPLKQDLLTNSQGQPHPLVLQNCLTLVAWPVFSSDPRIWDFLQSLPLSSVLHEGKVQQELTNQLGEDGFIGAVNGRLIRAHPL